MTNQRHILKKKWHAFIFHTFRLYGNFHSSARLSPHFHDDKQPRQNIFINHVTPVMTYQAMTCVCLCVATSLYSSCTRPNTLNIALSGGCFNQSIASLSCSWLDCSAQWPNTLVMNINLQLCTAFIYCLFAARSKRWRQLCLIRALHSAYFEARRMSEWVCMRKRVCTLKCTTCKRALLFETPVIVLNDFSAVNGQLCTLIVFW